VFANRIVSFDLQRHTAADQYTAAVALQKKASDEADATNQRQRVILDSTSVAKPFDERLNDVRAKITSIEDTVLRSCQGITHQSAGSLNVNQPLRLSSQAASDRLGESYIMFPMRQIYFSDAQAAQQCGNNFAAHNQEITTLYRQFQDVEREKDNAVNAFGDSKRAEVTPLQQRENELREEVNRLSPVVSELSRRAMEERVLGAPLSSENTDQAQTGTRQTDWAQIIQSNITRVSALAIMFFLVMVLVPQYRYNLRMAAFYDARADSIRLAGRLPTITDLQDLEKIIVAMTPNIDFGKAPATPLDQVVELIKATKQ
jgi:hypothetical protein